MADVAVARKQAEFEQLMAEKESERKQREAEEFHREQKRAQHALHMALLESEKKKAVANAKLQAIEQSIREEETTSIIQQQFELEDSTFRTQSWINSQQPQHPTAGDQNPEPNPPTRQRTADPPQTIDLTEQDHVNITQDNIQPFTPRGFAGNQPIFRPPSELPEVTVTSRCIESITQTNQQVATTLAQQNLPKCHRDSKTNSRLWRTCLQAGVTTQRILVLLFVMKFMPSRTRVKMS